LGNTFDPQPLPPPNAVCGPVGGRDFATLRIWAESFHDAQKARVALVNRMERGGIDSDLLAGHKDQLLASEHAFRLAMRRSYRRVVRAYMPSVEDWQKGHFGIGEDTLARILGHLGHPLIAQPYVWTDTAPDGHVCDPARCGVRHLVALEPYARSLRQLWSYCGHGAPLRRRKGMTQDDALALGSPQLKMLVHLLAEATIKCGPQPGIDPHAIPVPAGSTALPSEQPDRFRYRIIYDTRRATTTDRDWTPGHSHADALRIVGKEILRDLWTAAKADA